MGERSRNSGIADWAVRLVPAAILALAVPGKFGADPAAVAMFTELGVEPFGRWATGFFEALAVVLLLLPATTVYGGLLAAGLMSGALLAHVTVLGVAPGGDPTLFVMALASFLAALTLVGRRRDQIPVLGQLGRSGEASARGRG